MAVWVPDSEASARPAPYPTLATTAKVTVSGKSNKSLRAINVARSRLHPMTQARTSIGGL